MAATMGPARWRRHRQIRRRPHDYEQKLAARRERTRSLHALDRQRRTSERIKVGWAAELLRPQPRRQVGVTSPVPSSTFTSTPKSWDIERRRRGSPRDVGTGVRGMPRRVSGSSRPRSTDEPDLFEPVGPEPNPGQQSPEDRVVTERIAVQHPQQVGVGHPAGSSNRSCTARGSRRRLSLDRLLQVAPEEVAQAEEDGPPRYSSTGASRGGRSPPRCRRRGRSPRAPTTAGTPEAPAGDRRPDANVRPPRPRRHAEPRA